MYQYIERLEVPKKWFKANVDTIMRIYGQLHGIQKEDLFLGAQTSYQPWVLSDSCSERNTVIGTLDTPDYALFVSHTHPDGQVSNIH